MEDNNYLNTGKSQQYWDEQYDKLQDDQKAYIDGLLNCLECVDNVEEAYYADDYDRLSERLKYEAVQEFLNDLQVEIEITRIQTINNFMLENREHGLAR